MTSLFTAAILGVVEGLTEFLPVSSTGHLIITGHLLGFTGEKAASFEVAIQLGAILAVVVLYWSRFRGLIVPAPGQRFSGVRGLYMLFLTSLPASVLGLLTHGYIKEHLFTPYTVAWALGIGAIMILIVEKKEPRPNCFTLDEVTPKLALGIGLFQCLALWPGFSRSAATIMGGMLLGAKRSVAAEYSFIAAVPIMFAATGYDMLKSYKLFTTADIPFLSVGFLVSFVSAWIAVKGFIYLLGKLTLRPFAYYRLALAPLILFFWS
ncbi:undecaprenyl-diphosphate phosphatase [Maridesulfovibrio hydrothermalis]|uniref:Undecaprenyl-diphosphatase n=1 Tax=Maridesulfovibrio hydrothermalis AM13 = DSM 14728 TaxID=1121451 RepID=L0RGF0_9BACT|nr:undecaprenyl-diphosphate phosphatase [Maridesulfovibrio hydrothermalis]CCO24646.1 undecaprenyl pyrophosphate phosphatase [Maridesulfovibrio hydrothermalis AM13 = DSM 14728]